MDSSNTEFIKNALIKREIETSPWEAIRDLALTHLQAYYSELAMEQLEPFMRELQIEVRLDTKATITELSQAVLVNANFNETINYARKCLESEYAKIDAQDLEVLHRLFISEESQNSTLIPNLDLLERT
tara:strand:+ start:9706 stop:10092 length:387 start_codon:yes stop_codon:yes gene_type:complete